mmetsp:Transcript_19481/g.37704  ORF Transcript_19481/g.37704 Transcript_19481/m.37704 type:complete len:237 (-) Transcript_19481:266-976(-)|eukprot:CAMPEP_0167782132 /NCGR_PEP_ID=MMETSP0111_2-20121227/6343_1 /TAXON_ID=91324 /ORGANISM="Lotharella globosa, Strain CCCM811" /LENGTH=236 /DNA_ID=CAMNT_0007672921 /DNA_START=61 /DNA_END=771 /DNA_ORIENTATION=+
MTSLFGRAKKAPKKPDISARIKELKSAHEMLDKQEKNLEKQMAEATKMALKKSRQKNKKGALFHLKRKKMLEKRLNQLYGQRENVERLVNAMETVTFQKANIEKMKGAQQALKAGIEELDVDEVTEVMDDINENIAMADEIGEAMSETVGADVDEEDLEAELAELENEAMDEEMLKEPELPVIEQKTRSAEKKRDTTQEILAELEGAPNVPVEPVTVKSEGKRDVELDAVTASLGI